jgi:hypothetical protein
MQKRFRLLTVGWSRWQKELRVVIVFFKVLALVQVFQ